MPILGNYTKPSLGEGEFVVKVAGYRLVNRQSGSRALIVRVVTANDEVGEISFTLSENAFWKLAWFATDCGITKAELASWDTDDSEAHSILVGHVVRVVFETNAKGYLDAKRFGHATEEEIAAFPPLEIPF